MSDKYNQEYTREFGVHERGFNEDSHLFFNRAEKLKGNLKEAKEYVLELETNLKKELVQIALSEIMYKAATERVERTRFNIYEPD